MIWGELFQPKRGLNFNCGQFANFLCLFLAAIYLVVVAAIAAFVGQHVMGKLVKILGRASLIIFVVAFTIFVSAIALGEHYLNFTIINYMYIVCHKLYILYKIWYGLFICKLHL